jgi:uncharacterized protein (TIGR02145 family)
MKRSKFTCLLLIFSFFILLTEGCTKKKSDPAPVSPTITDIDGNVYNTVTIGTQVWMKENLKVTKYRNGDSIPNVTWGQWQALTTGAWCYYNNDISNNATYGKLYNWYTVTDSRNICPAGWHIPTDAEWTILTDYLGGESVAGGKMKEAGTTHWLSPNTAADNSSGFTGLPGGFRIDYTTFMNNGGSGYWWSSTETSTINVWYRSLDRYNGATNKSYYYKYFGFSVRCVKD